MRFSTIEKTVRGTSAYSGCLPIYYIQIKTDSKVTTNVNYTFDPKEIALLNSSNTAKTGPIQLKAGEKNTLVCNNSAVYDSYIVFEDNAYDEANKLGVKAEGMDITIPASLNNLNLKATLYVMTVDGKVQEKQNFNISTASATIDTPAELEASKYTITADKPGDILIGVADVFTYSEVETLSKKQFTLNVTSNNKDKFFYYTEENDGKLNVTATKFIKNIKADGTEETWTKADAISALKYVKFSVNKGGSSNQTVYSADAEAGTYELTIALLDAVGGNEVRKFTTDLEVAMPSIDDFVTKSAAWDGKTVTMNVDSSVKGNMMSIYSLKTDANKDNLNFIFNSVASNSVITLDEDAVKQYSPVYVTNQSSTVPSYTLAKDRKSFTVRIAAGEFNLSGGAIKETKSGNDKWYLQPITFTAVYNVNGVDIKGEASTMNVVNLSAGDKLVYLNKNGQETSIALNSSSQIEIGQTATASIEAAIKDYAAKGDEATSTINPGLYLYVDGAYKVFDSTAAAKYEISLSSKDQIGESAAVHVQAATEESADGNVSFGTISSGVYDFTLNVVDKTSMQVENNDATQNVYYNLPSLTVSKK